MRSIGVLFFIACIAAPWSVNARDIVVRDADGHRCVDIAIGGSGEELYVMGSYEGLSGLPGAEFRIDGLPPEWIVSVDVGPEVTFTLGDPFLGGTNVALANCYPGSNNEVLLFSVLVNPTTVESAVLELAAHTTPSSPLFSCPLLYLCPPADGAYCLPAGPRAVINGGETCPVSVEQATWAGVKELYR
jgi:hypothetical protein